MIIGIATAITFKDSKGKIKESVPFVSTKDSRGTERKSWSLSVKQDYPFTDGKSELKGAELAYSNLTYASASGAPTAKEEGVTLGTDAQELSSANAETGIGSWSLGLGNSLEDATVAFEKNGNGKLIPITGKVTNGVILSIPKNTVISTSKYATTVTYELTADATK
ncbi:WxL domain-containing protein [Lactococcus garvieae]|uniref:WxL domain-containing protein n=1 Tax=Lactococcus garvieae TaxID=1363 RepID=UPI00398F614E